MSQSGRTHAILAKVASQRTARLRREGGCGGGGDKREWSGRRDSNPRPTAWKAVTLPLSYSRWEQIWWRRMDSNHRRAKPSRFTVCPLWPLGYASKELSSFVLLRAGSWSRHPESNRGPTVYKTVALPLSYAGGAPL